MDTPLEGAEADSASLEVEPPPEHVEWHQIVVALLESAGLRVRGEPELVVGVGVAHRKALRVG